MDIKNWIQKIAGKFSASDDSVKTDSELTNVESAPVKPKMTPEDVVEKFNDGFVRLIDRLEGINSNISRQLEQNEQMAGKISEIPRIMESFPDFVRNQGEVVDQMRSANQLNQNVVKAIETIPQETLRQTDAIYDVRDTMSDSLEVNKSVKNELGRFNDTISRLEATAAKQTESIMQMGRTFASSERYFKYIMDKQTKRFLWIFITALSVCMVSLFSLAGIIIYLMLK